MTKILLIKFFINHLLIIWIDFIDVLLHFKILSVCNCQSQFCKFFSN
jgi:hypothetical protein